MAYIFKPVQNYQIYYDALAEGPVMISLVGGQEWLGNLSFYEDSRMPTANGLIGPSPGKPNLAYRRSQFQDVLNLLREEKPIYFTWNTETKRGGLQTDPEPIGEDEGP